MNSKKLYEISHKSKLHGLSLEYNLVKRYNVSGGSKNYF